MLMGTINKQINIAGLIAQAVIERSGAGAIAQQVPLPEGLAGTIDTGVITLGAGHGVTEADTVDVYWNGGVRCGLTVAGADENTILVTGGDGDTLPSDGEEVVVGVQQEVNMDVDGDDIEIIAATCDQRAHADFQDSDDASLAAVEIPTAGESWEWAGGSGIANPLAGNAIDKVLVSNGSTSAATLKIALIYNSVQ